MKIKGKGIFFKYSRRWSKTLLAIAAVKVNVTGLENIEAGRGIIFISNHASNFDIPILLANLPTDTLIMYKQELEKVPVFGLCLKLSPFVAVDRENPREAMKSIDSAREIIRNGGAMVIFPEGTRSPNGEIGEFKRGAFMIAKGSGVDLTPLAISGSYGIMKRGSFIINPGNCLITISKPVKLPDILNKVTEKTLSDFIKDKIISNL